MQDSLPVQDSLAGFLSSMGFPPYGDLTPLPAEERQKTIECIEALLRARQKDAQARETLATQVLTLEQEKRTLMRDLDYANDKIEVLKGDVGRADNAVRVNASKWKTEKDKLTTEKDDLKKDFSKLCGARDQLLHEIKKRDGQISKLQDQARKTLGDCGQIKSNIELIVPMPAGGVAGATAGELGNTYRRSYEEIVGKLAEENETLKGAVALLMDGMQERIKRAQACPNASTDLLSLQFPSGKVTSEGVAKSLAETTLSLVDLFLAPGGGDMEEDRENEDSEVRTITEARMKLSKSHTETYKQLFTQQEQVLQSFLCEREALAVIDASSLTSEFHKIAGCVLSVKKPESAPWREFSSSYV